VGYQRPVRLRPAPPSLRHILPSRTAIVGERKHVSVLFADIRRSTALIDQLDAEQALEILSPVLRVATDLLPEHHGFVNQTREDGIMALFGALITNDDHALKHATPPQVRISFTCSTSTC
jgi:class 3 adenylate cyclase